ncbi:MAG TPA: DUF2625 domain-containing protein [Candidatus Paceibacterota bacterium]|nr:DUF2625 domain-containing protein [Candidatus Paceibacterota bacterium]
MRPLEELVETQDPAWPLVQSWIETASNAVNVLPVDRDKADAALVQLQVTTRSPMGAIVHHTGGLLIDHGWLRVLGSGSQRLPRSLPDWNAQIVRSPAGAPPPFLLIADDILGGFFAIDGGGLTGAPGKVHYFAPDSLDWQNLGSSYSDFIRFLLSGDLERFYQGTRWPAWPDELADLPGDRGLSVYPFLWAKGPAIAERSRRAVPLAELWNLQQDIRRQMRGAG